jgi:predicted nucleotidyltransferase
MTDYALLLKALAEADVDFILVDGVAATALGSARLTQDVDVVYSRKPDNIARLVSALEPYHPYLRGAPPGLPFRWSGDTIRSGLNFTLTTSIGDIDLLGDIVVVGAYEDLLQDTTVLQLYGIECRCVTLRRLILLKRAAGQPRDLDAIAELEAILEERNGED